ncbi:MAG: hypothetical protein GF341_00195 [candidate division Zixibacteria bacterium]|nr:hypothetical protein [candidate division Zixibacteria bacterium]
MNHGNDTISYEYRFGPSAPIPVILETLVLAVAAAESLHGRARVRSDSQVHVNTSERLCFVEGLLPIAEDLARIFTGFLSRKCKADDFSVRQLDQPSGSTHEGTSTLEKLEVDASGDQAITLRPA